MAELKGEPQNHLEGMGVVIPNQVSLSDDDEDLTTGTPHSRTNHYVGTPNLAHARNPNLTKNIYIGFCLEMQIFDGLNINYCTRQQIIRLSPSVQIFVLALTN